MATKYNSKFTGEQIDNSVETVVSNTATDGQVLTANGTGGSTWQDAKGTEVVANPVLAGTESDLTGLEVAGTKYKVPSGGSGGGNNSKHIYLFTFKNVKSIGGYTLSTPIEIQVINITSNEISSYEITNGLYIMYTYTGGSSISQCWCGTLVDTTEGDNQKVIIPYFSTAENTHILTGFNKSTNKPNDSQPYTNYFNSILDANGTSITPTFIEIGVKQ